MVVVNAISALSGSLNVRFPVGTPAVGMPKKRVLGRPLSAIATASPALAVCGLMSTASGAALRSTKVYP